MNSRHPDYYTQLLERRCQNDPTLTVNERRELDLHLVFCRRCNADYATFQAEHLVPPAMPLWARLKDSPPAMPNPEIHLSNEA